MARVFVVQETKWVDPADGQLKPKFDLSPAAVHGELVHMLEPGASPFNLEPVLDKLHEHLATYTPQDFLLLIGSPVLLGLATAIAADYGQGNVRMLQWSGAKRAYVPVFAENVFGDSD